MSLCTCGVLYYVLCSILCSQSGTKRVGLLTVSHISNPWVSPRHVKQCVNRSISFAMEVLLCWFVSRAYPTHLLHYDTKGCFHEVSLIPRYATNHLCFSRLDNIQTSIYSSYDFHPTFVLDCVPGSWVGIATDLRAGRSGIESWWGRDFPPVQTGPGAHPASCKMGTGSFPGVKCGRGVLLTTHPLIVPQSWKSRAIPLPTLWATPGL